jgi:hypothetical protein
VIPTAGLEDNTAPIEIIRQPHSLGFLRWDTRTGETTLYQNPTHQHVPLLYSVYQSGQRDTQNILETLLTSEAISYTASLRLKVGFVSDIVGLDYRNEDRWHMSARKLIGKHGYAGHG